MAKAQAIRRAWRGLALPLAAALLAMTLVTPAGAQEHYKLNAGQWEKQATYDPASPEGRLQAIRKVIAEDRPAEAWALADQWIKDYPNHPLLVEAYLLRGDAKSARRDYYKALYDYEAVIRLYPASEQYQTALDREYQIAQLFAHGLRRKLWGMRIMPADDEAEEIFIRTQERSPGSELGEKASLALADFYFDRGNMTSAATAYDLFLVNYPRSEHREGVLLRLIQASLATFKGPQFDSTGLIEAGVRIKQYQREYPAAAERIGADALLVRIDESLALKAYFTAKWYDDLDKKISAIYLYQRVVRDYPQSAAARTSIDRLRELGAPAVGTVNNPPATAPAGPRVIKLPDIPATTQEVR